MLSFAAGKIAVASGGRFDADNLTITNGTTNNNVAITGMLGAIDSINLIVGSKADTTSGALLSASGGTIEVSKTPNVGAGIKSELTIGAATTLYLDTLTEDTTSTGTIGVDKLIMTGNLKVEDGTWTAKAIENSGTGSLIASGATLSVASLNAKAGTLTVHKGTATIKVANATLTTDGAWGDGADKAIDTSTLFFDSAFYAATDAGTVDSNYVAASGAVMSDGDSMYIVEASTGSMENGIGLWVMPMYQNTNSGGFESGAYEYGYDSDLLGASIGADYTFGNSLRVGAAFHLGSGDSDSTGDFASTENDFDYYGFSLYSGYMIGNLGLSADLGYTQSSNEVTQSSNVGQLKSEFDADVITAGLRAEYNVSSSILDIIPHLGLRLNDTDVESYSTKYAGGTAFHTDSSDATAFAIPMGVTLQKDIKTASGILLTPSVDLGVQFTMGDLDVDQDVHISGVNGSASMESEIFDAVTFQAGLGLGVKKDNLGFDLDYKINASSNVVSQGVMGTFRYEF